MKQLKNKVILIIFIVLTIISGCSSSSPEDKIIKESREIINKDLSDEISINQCLYNKEKNAVYLEFYSSNHSNDKAIILLDDNSIFYDSIYQTIEDDDYEKIIEYGDYALIMAQLTINGGDDQWTEIEINN